MDIFTDPGVMTSLFVVGAHVATAAGVWLYRRHRRHRSQRHRSAHERDRVQKKTFTKWVNKHLIKVRKHITDLYEDLRDGHNLISLLEVLSGVTLVKLVNIRNDDITDGNPKLTLGLIWTIILHFQVSLLLIGRQWLMAVF
ncbi:hypothetical protein NHX12_023623 [Muraenolepis orangiensis]|uniref:Calponin-homology (CH) domain-containing protein n=1 Tax=Muraenolepis orangiensis TaxID=630683 RepID=A0A9Q0ELF4_9TELE|nr:hypothetical protein NHX12_023623 [Muraenolepis orangiensis]